MGTLMAALDRNIIVIALPSISSDLHTSLITLVWITIGYWVVTSSVLLTFGRLADMFGRVRLYNLGFALFTIGSGLCCISSTGEQLIIFRIIQGIGAAFIFSNGSAILSDSFSESERGKALGINQIAIVIGSVIGLVLGGVLTSYLGWRSIFWINIPIGILATLWAYRKLKEMGSIKKEKVDYFGNILMTLSMLFILIGITFGSFHLLNTFMVLLLLSVGVIMLIIFYYAEKKILYPMIDLTLFRIKNFTSNNLTIFLNSMARGAFSFVIVFYLQGPSMMLSPLDAGIYLIPISLTLAIFAPITGWFYDKLHSPIISQIGLLISAAGFLLLTTLGNQVSFIELVLPLSLIGSGMGIFNSPNRAAIMNSVSPNNRGIAAGISTTLVMTGSAFSIALIFIVFSIILPPDETGKIFSGSFADITNSKNIESDMIFEKFMNALHLVFFISALLMISSVFIQYLLRQKT